jgi:hypothetical protein
MQSEFLKKIVFTEFVFSFCLKNLVFIPYLQGIGIAQSVQQLGWTSEI